MSSNKNLTLESELYGHVSIFKGKMKIQGSAQIITGGNILFNYIRIPIFVVGI